MAHRPYPADRYVAMAGSPFPSPRLLLTIGPCPLPSGWAQPTKVPVDVRRQEESERN